MIDQLDRFNKILDKIDEESIIEMLVINWDSTDDEAEREALIKLARDYYNSSIIKSAVNRFEGR